MQGIFSASFLGKGYAFPMEQNLGTGDVTGASEEANVEASIRMFLSTVAGERIMLESYGLPRILFSNVDSGTADVVRRSVEMGLARFEPRVRTTRVDVRPSKNAGMTGVTVVVNYTIRSTNTETNLVFFTSGNGG